MSLLVYVAGASKEVDRPRLWIRRLNELRPLVEVTFDWTGPVKERQVRGLVDDTLTDAVREQYATLDSQAILAAHIVWVQASIWDSTGQWWEMGFAHGLRTAFELLGSNGRDIPELIISGEATKRCIFAWLPNVVRLPTDGYAHEYILRAALRRLPAESCAMCGRLLAGPELRDLGTARWRCEICAKGWIAPLSAIASRLAAEAPPAMKEEVCR